MSPDLLWLFLVLSVCLSLVSAQGPVQTFFPASIPLSIRSPYLSVWQQSTNGSNPLSSSWPLFWTQQSIMGWTGKIRVDSVTYGWMGDDGINNSSAIVKNIQVTPTRSIFVFQAGPMNVTVTFLSPIEPTDWVKQSLPFSYVSVEAQSTDGASHDVQMYSDISAEWVSGDRTNSPVKWSQNTSGNTLYLQIELETPAPYTEISHQAQDGTSYYAMTIGTGQTWQIDKDTTCRTQFEQHGVLGNTATNNFGVISPVFSVYAISVDLGSIQSTSTPVSWAVGFVRDPSIKYNTPQGASEDRRPYYTTQYPEIGSAIDAFTGDFSAAYGRAVALDQKIMTDAAKISSNYVDLVSLAARQTVGSMDITVNTDSNGQVNASDVKIFVKDIGTSGRVNPVERLFAAWPAFLYLNASWAGAMLQPLLETQDGLTGLPYAAQDLGPTYPQVTGSSGSHPQGIEQSGNMLIMQLAYARISGDGSLLTPHYNLTKKWADFLVSNTLTPLNQESADWEMTPNMTNLAIKGIIGVKAMAEISRAVGNTFDAQQYDSHASALIGSWQSLALSSDQQHLLGIYANQPSWALLYNLYADKLLGTNLVAQSLLDEQSSYYGSLLQTAPPFGLPIDSSVGQTSSGAWSLLTSATVADTGVRDQLIQGVWARANSNLTVGTFPDQYNDASGAVLNGTAGPSLGAMFAHLALTVPNTTISTTSSGFAPSSSPSNGGDGSGGGGGTTKHTDIGAIVGGVVGGLAAVGIIAGALFYFFRKRRYHRADDSEKVEIFESNYHQPALAPYFYTNPETGSVHASYRDPASNVDSPSDTSAGAAGLGAAGGLGDRPGPNARASPDDSAPRAIPSSKARERALNTQYQYAASASGSSALGSAVGSAVGSAPGSDSSREPLSPGSTGAGAASLSSTDVVGLRAEVENLRRVMQEIRADRFEPPPEYAG